MFIGEYNFTDPVQITDADNINIPAVYVVMTNDTRKWSYIYVGQTSNVGDRFDAHEKWECWKRNADSSGLYASVMHESNEDSRLLVESNLAGTLPGLQCNLQ